ncbi:MAG: methyltransferase domain-containing protein [Desulfocapsa sp.]|nr:methyltransferase domain-containing protein [Desulfocapsa sp.]
MELTNMVCPLCEGRGSSEFFYKDTFRVYYRCDSCDLIHVSPSQRLSSEAEKAEYDKHQNSPEDVGYRRFLNRLYAPLIERIEPQSCGLDFGSGPGPTLSLMFEEAGHKMSLYDPYFAPDKTTLDTQYDFITASEVVEHLYHPSMSLTLLWSLLLPGGWLGLMTKLARDVEAFSTWHYKNDSTHVCFFSRTTMSWLARKWQTECVFVGNDVALFKKPATSL